MTETTCGQPHGTHCPLAGPYEYGLHRCHVPDGADHPLSPAGMIRVVVHRCACGLEWTQTRKEADREPDERAIA